ncbi:MAG: hypothetical protein LBP71_06680 [Spirochaetaceae bacterium]|nr:hypothetical protein [Spirochaetaceae bacterium]
MQKNDFSLIFSSYAASLQSNMPNEAAAVDEFNTAVPNFDILEPLRANTGYNSLFPVCVSSKSAAIIPNFGEPKKVNCLPI